jgi:hypothetical protein
MLLGLLLTPEQVLAIFRKSAKRNINSIADTEDKFYLKEQDFKVALLYMVLYSKFVPKGFIEFDQKLLHKINAASVQTFFDIMGLQTPYKKIDLEDFINDRRALTFKKKIMYQNEFKKEKLKLYVEAEKPRVRRFSSVKNKNVDSRNNSRSNKKHTANSNNNLSDKNTTNFKSDAKNDSKSKDNKNNTVNKDTKSVKDTKDSKDTKENKSIKDTKDTKSIKDNKDNKDNKVNKDAKDNKDKDPKNNNKVDDKNKTNSTNLSKDKKDTISSNTNLPSNNNKNDPKTNSVVNNKDKAKEDKKDDKKTNPVNSGNTKPADDKNKSNNEKIKNPSGKNENWAIEK